VIIDDFLSAMVAQGFSPGEIIADGAYHRFDIKRGDRNGYYNLDANGRGVFGNWKTGEQYKFRSGNFEKMTEQERAEAYARYKKQQREIREATQNREAQAAIDAAKIWNESTPAATHWYLDKKKVKPHNARIDKAGCLIIPIYSNGKIVNIQRITKTKKLFQYGAKKRGCYSVIVGDKGVIFIAEGWATAASINEATGHYCIVALDAGNLLPVARNIRDKLGVDQRIIIAADNDQWTEVNGEKKNVGIESAQAAAEAIYAEVKFPCFSAEDTERFTDWNDYACVHGLESTKAALLSQEPDQPNDDEPPPFDAPPDWYEGNADNKPMYLEKRNGNIVNERESVPIAFDFDENGKPKGTIENLAKIAQSHNITLRYNVIKKQEEIIIPNEGYSLDNAQNASYARMLSMCREVGMPITQVGDYLTYICDKNQYNPVTTWIESKPWDGVSRLQDFFDTVKSPNVKVKELVLKRWMVSAVASAFSENGLSTRGVLVFQGEQYLGKTSWFKKLVPSHLDVRKDGYILRIDDKDSVFQCLTHWLIELGELEATFKKSDIAQLKAFIPMDKDILRRPYARKDSHYARRTVFFASVNQREFLYDDTGNTRFWSINTTGLNYNHTIDMQQLWAEFRVLQLAGEPYIMLPDEMATVNSNNEEFMGSDQHDEVIARKFDWEDYNFNGGGWKTASEIAKIVGLTNPKQQDLNRLSKSVRKYNGDKHKRGAGGIRLLQIPKEVIGGVTDNDPVPQVGDIDYWA